MFQINVSDKKTNLLKLLVFLHKQRNSIISDEIKIFGSDTLCEYSLYSLSAFSISYIGTKNMGKSFL